MRNHRTRTLLVVTAALSAALGFGPVFAADVGPSSGNKAAHVRGSQSAVVPFLAPGINVTGLMLAKGRRGHSVPLEVSANFFNVADTVRLAWAVTINGVTVQPNAWEASPCSPATLCLASFTWWADLDELEAANPGQFVGQPLNIVYTVSDVANAGTSTTLVYSASARLEKR